MLIFSYGNLQAKITNNSECTKYPAMFFWIQHKQKAGCKADNVTKASPWLSAWRWGLAVSPLL